MNNEVKLNPEHHDDYFQGGDGEDQVQLPPEKHEEEGEYEVQHSPEHHVITCMQKKVEIKSNTMYRTQW